MADRDTEEFHVFDEQHLLETVPFEVRRVRGRQKFRNDSIQEALKELQSLCPKDPSSLEGLASYLQFAYALGQGTGWQDLQLLIAKMYKKYRWQLFQACLTSDALLAMQADFEDLQILQRDRRKLIEFIRSRAKRGYPRKKLEDMMSDRRLQADVGEQVWEIVQTRFLDLKARETSNDHRFAPRDIELHRRIEVLDEELDDDLEDILTAIHKSIDSLRSQLKASAAARAARDHSVSLRSFLRYADPASLGIMEALTDDMESEDEFLRWRSDAVDNICARLSTNKRAEAVAGGEEELSKSSVAEEMIF